MSSPVERMTIRPQDAEEILSMLRWKEDMTVINPFGEYVWLKPCLSGGKRIGITDCCEVKDPCSRHRWEFAQ